MFVQAFKAVVVDGDASHWPCTCWCRTTGSTEVVRQFVTELVSHPIHFAIKLICIDLLVFLASIARAT